MVTAYAVRRRNWLHRRLLADRPPDPERRRIGQGWEVPTNKNLRAYLDDPMGGLKFSQTYSTNVFPFIKIGKKNGLSVPKTPSIGFAIASESEHDAGCSQLPIFSSACCDKSTYRSLSVPNANNFQNYLSTILIVLRFFSKQNHYFEKESKCQSVFQLNGKETSAVGWRGPSMQNGMNEEAP
jgi:hypothetical protein